MASRTRLANDAWEALLSAHARLMKQFAAEDIWQDRGLVERCPDPADGRGVRLSLTEAGRDRQRQIGRRHAGSVARALTAELSPDQLRQLATIGWKLAGQPADTGASTSDNKEMAHL
jgi:hypothetical protein